MLLAVPSLELLRIPFFVNKATYEVAEFGVSITYDVFMRLDVGCPSPDRLIDAIDVVRFHGGIHLALDW